ncbi:unnamed protein product [Agarophyton chilense]
MAFVSSLSLASRVRAPTLAKCSPFRLSVRAAPARRAALVMNLDTIQVKIQEEIKKAEEATKQFGRDSKEAALAWDVVEELEAEASHMKVDKGKPDPLEQFCEDSPDADECRVYDN